MKKMNNYSNDYCYSQNEILRIYIGSSRFEKDSIKKAWILFNKVSKKGIKEIFTNYSF
ncbi:MAG: hypothetical protein ACOC56_04015 [Atribacterota bacterium]